MSVIGFSEAGAGERADATTDKSIVESVAIDIDRRGKPADVGKILGKAVKRYRTIEWPELMPEDDLNAILDSPDYLDDIVDGSLEDQLAGSMSSASTTLKDLESSAQVQRYQDALVSTRIVPEFDGQSIRVPGFIVPLDFGDEQQKVTRFFLVPYFGACIHVPPPPPNQIIYAEYGKGFDLESLYDPFWVSGVLSTTLIENDTATSAYAIKVERLEPYTE